MYHCLNARYIKKNCDIMLAYISEYNTTIVTFTETGLSSNNMYTITIISNFSTNLHNYSFIRSDRVYGVGIMIHNDFRII